MVRPRQAAPVAMKVTPPHAAPTGDESDPTPMLDRRGYGWAARKRPLKNMGLPKIGA